MTLLYKEQSWVFGRLSGISGMEYECPLSDFGGVMSYSATIFHSYSLLSRHTPFSSMIIVLMHVTTIG